MMTPDREARATLWAVIQGLPILSPSGLRSNPLPIQGFRFDNHPRME